ncbi:probable aspartic protease At2g35615 [Papaver somniferum]|uniref:probable aspartic protease At2g35615 n=1 Tax=Papaver somniferum TaxID=3469 RepID=UPI000E6F60A7|nr:probable aspartic protease At2g35615 [Papaver somniferum]
MIHRDSRESPFYPGDHLTQDERLQRFVEQSKAQARYIESQILHQNNATRSINLDVARLPVVYEPRTFYVATLGLGTFPGERPPFKNYYLMIDSGSELTWLQCEGATKAFNQDMPLYPWHLSTTYHPMPCNTHPLCKGDRCNANGECIYERSYQAGSVTAGVLAKETLTVRSDIGGSESMELYMGCGFNQENFDIGDNHLRGKPDLIAGILGLGSGSWSFVNQLGDEGQGKYSYCFEPYNSNIGGSDTYLRFGEDAKIGGAFSKVYTTPMVVTQFPTQLYYLKLEDISVGNNKIRFPRGTFEVNSKGVGGTAIDSGTPISMMYKYHFDRVANLVKEHFSKLGVEYIGSQEYFDVCFRLRGKFDINNYPSITYHFQQADYVISDYKANFVMLSIDTVCLAIFSRDSNTPSLLLGAMQQINKRILYNVMDQSLSFASEHCELDS